MRKAEMPFPKFFCAPGVGLELVSVSFSHKKKGEKIKIWRKKRCLKQKKKEIEREK